MVRRNNYSLINVPFATLNTILTGARYGNFSSTYESTTNESGVSKRESALDVHFDEIVNIRFLINVTGGYLYTRVIVRSFHPSGFKFITRKSQ